ncbi:hypothetical protein JK386_13805 [Nocardioides sp. zg-536]|uniref:Uncharacterized protein n=1 Tax=Nocardioides faecalis TaxID=2803858 RepID=A0A938Y866_9ACTN|nr:hypothetical protein [Nocardioides faecalis]MBM9460972.1 hypothetical protein [Nocardioides faecalis]MBS4751963.1 hypothetical protein [Nocardioides faecalis]QVI59206.1 hypothetical protein KG111_02160 [Nocardioides faecalis]
MSTAPHTAPQPQARRRRHLMDPAHPVRPVDDRSLTQVQRWVMSTLVVFTAAHMAGAMVFAAIETPASATAARIGLNIIAGAFMVIAVAGGRAIHKHSPLTAWLLVAPATTALGLWLTFTLG